MPKDAKSKEAWIIELRKIAQGGQFARREAPRIGSWAAQEVVNIKKCAITNGNINTIDMKAAICTCSYHPQKISKPEIVVRMPSTNPISSNGATNLTQATEKDISERLPKGWRETIDPLDHTWIARSMFTDQKKLVTSLHLWWYPPQARHVGYPSIESYFGKRLFLWEPYRMWKFLFKCVRCPKSLTNKGIYNRVRTVLDFRTNSEQSYENNRNRRSVG